VPETEATPYAMTLLAVGPRYFNTEFRLTNTPTAPAIKKLE